MTRARVAVALLLFASPLRAADPPALRDLRAYLRLDTSNPPGNERAAALFLKGRLEAAGIASEIFEPAPGRANLVARLPGGGLPGLLLHHHMDVVPAGPDGWTSPPFAAEEAGTRLTARGVIDDKGLGIAELHAFLSLAGKRLKRDVVLLATADEEAGGRYGVAAVRKSRPAWLAGVGFSIGEGGVTETVTDRQRYFGIEVAQKSALWLRLTARGEGGHPASPDPRAPTARLARALGTLASWDRPLAVEPTVEEALDALARVRPKGLAALLTGLPAAVARDPERVRRELTPRYLSLLTDTIAITRLGPEGKATNVLPAVAWADVDCRLLPSTDPAAFLAELKRKIAPEEIHVEVLLQAGGGGVSAKGELYELVARHLKRRFPGVEVGPDVSPGVSENRVFREMGMAAYGLTPFRINVYDQSGIHGVNERLRTDWFLEGVELLTQIVADFAAEK